MIQISPDALREGCERAHDLFLLNRLRGREEAAASFDAVYQALGVDAGMREDLQHALDDLVPVRGVPVIEATTVVLDAGWGARRAPDRRQRVAGRRVRPARRTRIVTARHPSASRS